MSDVGAQEGRGRWRLAGRLLVSAAIPVAACAKAAAPGPPVGGDGEATLRRGGGYRRRVPVHRRRLGHPDGP